MEIVEQEQNAVSVFKLAGRIDSEGAIELDLALQAAVVAGKHNMVLDMGDVRYINSAGLRTLADVLTENQENGGDLRLVNLNPKVQRVFEIIGFDNFFTIYDTIDEAVAAFSP